MRKYIWLNTVFIIALAVLLVVSALHIATGIKGRGGGRLLLWAAGQYRFWTDAGRNDGTHFKWSYNTPWGTGACPHIRRSISFASTVYRCGRVALLWAPLINYPIARGYDNNHLRHLLNGTYNTAGTLFADYRNGKIGADHNFVIFGHNVNNETMFGSIEKYKNQEYYDAHPSLYYFTADHIYQIERIAGCVTTVRSDAYTINFETEELLRSYVAYVNGAI